MSEFDDMFGIGTGVSPVPSEPSAQIRNTAEMLHQIFTALTAAGFEPGTVLYLINNLLARAVFGR